MVSFHVTAASTILSPLAARQLQTVRTSRPDVPRESASAIYSVSRFPPKRCRRVRAFSRFSRGLSAHHTLYCFTIL